MTAPLAAFEGEVKPEWIDGNGHMNLAYYIVLFDQAYWRRMINFDALVEEDVIAPEDLALFEFADTAEAAWEALVRRGLKAHTS